MEAEHGTLDKAGIKEEKDASGGKAVRLNNKNSSLLIEDVNVPEGGTYTLTIGYSNSAGPNALQQVSVNGMPETTVSLPHTGSKQFAEISMQVELKKGYRNTIRFAKGKHSVEIDYIELSGDNAFSVKSGAEYMLINPHGGKALEAIGADTENDVPIRMGDDRNGIAAQRWQIVDLGDSTYALIHQGSGKALTVQDPQAPWGAVVIRDNQGLDTQRWKILDTGSGYCKLINVGTGKALDVGGASIDSGAGVGTWQDLQGGIAQFWLLYQLD
ncbi:RICIN domain-containing protein [Paenibacillus spongiae]|uniref:RICIN domain-containing protein n=1 Tax=Paenibacillus spongiae TaxID=2909671 RepID=A0ABY5SIG4_9BACL|nr:RICIN domain-containing protein [Paenibacillus spongiae]